METATKQRPETAYKHKEISREEQAMADYLLRFSINVAQQIVLKIKLHEYRVDYLLTCPHYPGVKILAEYYGSWHFPYGDQESFLEKKQAQANHDRQREEIINRYLQSQANSKADPQELLILDCLRPHTENLAIVLNEFEQRCPIATQERIEKVKEHWKQSGKLKEYHLKQLHKLKNQNIAV